MEFSILGGGVYPISITFFGKKNVFFHENHKDDQNGLIHPENWRLKFFIIGGVRAEISALSQTFWLQLFGQNIWSEADINFFFKVLAKFGIETFPNTHVISIPNIFISMWFSDQ